MKRNEETAFPCTETLNPGESFSPGMSLRDYFAASVLPAIYREFWIDQNAGRLGALSPDWRSGLAIDAYAMADAMLKAREAA